MPDLDQGLELLLLILLVGVDVLQVPVIPEAAAKQYTSRIIKGGSAVRIRFFLFTHPSVSKT